VTHHARHEYAEALRARYRAATKQQKGRILDEYCRTTGCHRKAAIRRLSEHSPPGRRRCRGRPRRYGPEVVPVLVRLWEVSDRLCGKLLAPFLPLLVAALERHGTLPLAPALRKSLEGLSPATIDRLLRPIRRRLGRQPRRAATPGALKGQIPLRTWSDWTAVRPGALQGDLVLHCGESTEGFFLTTLVGVDVATSWTELEAVWGLGQQRVGTGVHHLRERLPFPLREWHTDNGSEFINAVLIPWCQREGIRVTRGRGYRKNDQAWVEQKNWLVVRRLVGYDRYSSRAAYALLERLYGLLRLQLNFFRPVRKLLSKQRHGAKVLKRYDAAQTPYQRVVAMGELTDVQRQTLEHQFLAIDPAALARQIDQTLEALWKLGDSQRPRKSADLG